MSQHPPPSALPPGRPGRHAGFNLVEIAIALVIIGFTLSAGLMALSAQSEVQKVRDTQKQLDDVREALIGFAIANGRLPCPATAATNGIESPAGGGACTNPYNGFLPAATLGLPNTDGTGYITDAWAIPANRLRYAVTTANTSAATTVDGIRNAPIAAMAPDLAVCASSTGITATTCGTAVALTGTPPNGAVAVIYSLGKNAASFPAGAGTDEAANLNGDRVFVSHPPTDPGATAPGGAFDDMVTWLAPGILYNRMIQGGRLP